MKNPFETEERNAYRNSMQRFVDTEINPYADAWDEAGSFPWELHQKAGALGMFAMGIDEKYGGAGRDSNDAFMRAWSAIELGKAAAGGVVASLGSRNIMTGPLQALASDDILGLALADIVSGKKGGALGITEAGGGSDVANIQTKAVKDGNHYVINGAKTFITGGMNASYFVIGARTGDAGLKGISLFFVEADTPGFSRTSVGRKMGWWASDTATLHFDDVRVPAENLLGQENYGFLQIMNNFNYERLAMAAQMVGMAQVCLTESIAYAQTRETFGKPMIKHQVIRHKIADMSAKIDAMEAYVNQICWNMNEGDMPVAELCKAKFLCSKSLEFCASEAMQIFGGAAYLRGNRVERIYREVKVMAIGGGSEEIMRDLAVRQMGL
jgi:acyl-CoA dehydrogenase